MSEIFRDRTEGAKARRQDLLRRRRDELVTMPHAVRSVVVARTARTAASLVVVLVGFALLVAASLPAFNAKIAALLPGEVPAVLSTLLVAMWGLGLLAYSVARSIGEHRFAVAMSRYVLPGEDLDHDVERLAHEHPDEAARQMAHRLEVRSAALPVAAASLVLPVTALYVAMAARAKGWPLIADFEVVVARAAVPLLVTAVLGFVTAIVMTRKGARAAVVAPITGVVAGALGLATLTLFGTGGGPRTWWVLVPTLLAGSVALTVRRLRIERELIEAEDPAAGSELFTFRGLIKTVRAIRGVFTVDNARRLLRHKTEVAVLGVAIVALATGTAPRHGAGTDGTSLAQTGLGLRPTGATAHALNPDKPIIESWPGGLVRVKVGFASNEPYELGSLSELAFLPHGWTAHVVIKRDEASSEGTIQVTPFPGDDYVESRLLGNSIAEQEFTASACDMRVPLGLRIVPPAAWATGEHVVVLTLEPRLSPAGCPLE